MKLTLVLLLAFLVVVSTACHNDCNNGYRALFLNFISCHLPSF